VFLTEQSRNGKHRPTGEIDATVDRTRDLDPTLHTD
jgi:hypothetical protein